LLAGTTLHFPARLGTGTRADPYDVRLAMMLLFASVTDFFLDPIVNAGTDFISSTGLPAVFILMALESACLPVPSEAIMLFAGSSVAAGDLTMFGVVAAGVLGNLVGSWIAYAVGYYGRLDLLEKNKLIHISPKHLKWADDWFERYGAATVFFSRMLPIVRTFISLPAGIAKMPFWRFTVYTLAGCIPWVLMLALIGQSVGDNWEEWRGHLHYLDYAVVVAVVGLIAYLLIKRRGGGGTPEGDDPTPVAEPARSPGA
jgi:membrane protein DedA with SNARE-associated domain